MSDQAKKLRSLRLIGSPGKRTDRSNDERPNRRPRVRTLAISSGKGGVGKSTVVTNLALAFQRRGYRVLLVDGDLALANIDLLFGLIPKQNLGDVILSETPIEEIVIETPYGVRLLPAASGLTDLADLDDFRRESLIRRLSAFEETCDLILIDTGSGIGRQTIHFAEAADQVVILTTPEPTAFSDAYALLKVLSRRRKQAIPGLVVNRVSSVQEGRETAGRIQAVARRFLGFEPEYLGHIYDDPSMLRAVIQQEPLLEIFPHSIAAGCLESLADALSNEPEPNDPITVDPEEGFFQKVANFDTH